jgi:hypothetical protein
MATPTFSEASTDISNRTLTGQALQQVKMTYHHKLGQELAECAKQSKDLKGCMEKSTAKGDRFQKR